MNQTLLYYNQHANQFAQGTISVDFSDTQERFLGKLCSGARILDFGCGAGRDTKCFLNRGYSVDAVDGSEELCRLASEYAGINVRKMLFQELDAVAEYDGIWACSSILHLNKEEMDKVLDQMIRALKENGVIYTSFKYGDFSGSRGGRFFTDFTLDGFKEFFGTNRGAVIEDSWITSDVRPGRENEKWLNLVLRKI